ncbi:MAG TPA: HypC/HybG/HupF family hydrogenase formation chaperone [Polyangiaceae bacterium LLY-WYZ-15_(1-7)]|nr:HypC/HybG/HupF family hydrogenase formation chaperone [Sandaracinus sp.]HJK93430.1 HypC/HybG/HupF family hydrogenase formation chaperone [Polyangiaceae bacterium LLY-WYZ-15_(1-7)]HJL05369.1 HypC/HybG/HupF family hydrogenase formation chaperone [Polyangiaceae bacterium LLY-WYZ-15_(1-7)]HJL07256.1 HypC/HybG/HupF family hydrogenase formation chaperone [Polyangiaceae bacterium LLY-WYZ-15_(1-7)]HJL23200.1 HypC/HybG/HupF family hydrogenase formation chaperone [Polyangiaceae bacterium LLY-WYZ-15_(1
MCLAVPGRVESVREGEGGLRFGAVRFGTVVRDVCLEYVPDARAGDWVIVHVGFAIQRLDEGAAKETLALLEEAVASGEGA